MDATQKVRGWVESLIDLSIFFGAGVLMVVGLLTLTT